MNSENVDSFFILYEEKLKEAITNNPQEYCYPVANAPVVAQKMKAAVVAGTASVDGKAFKATCKQLGIKHTNKAIQAYLRG